MIVSAHQRSWMFHWDTSLCHLMLKTCNDSSYNDKLCTNIFTKIFDIYFSILKILESVTIRLIFKSFKEKR